MTDAIREFLPLLLMAIVAICGALVAFIHQRYFDRGLSLLVCLTVLMCGSSANACNRCGLFGNRCSFNSHHVVQQVAYQAPAAQASSTNFVFNNTFPTPYLLSGQQGQSVYGYSLASAPYTLDANLFMDRASRFTELALQSSDDANKAFAANTASAMALNDSADRRTKNTLLALSAIQSNGDPNPNAKALSFQATVGSNGRLSIKQIEATTVTGGTRPAGIPPSFALGLCSKCHDGSGAGGAPPALVLDGSKQLLPAQFDACVAKMAAGEMPPPAKMPPLSPAEAVNITAALCSLKGGALLPAQ